MKKSIAEQVGVPFASRVSAKIGHITVSRPYDGREQTNIFHRGSVESFLSNPAYESGVWLFEIDNENSYELHLVRWREKEAVWEYLGETKGGVL